jgi:hypothetical protein
VVPDHTEAAPDLGTSPTGGRPPRDAVPDCALGNALDRVLESVPNPALEPAADRTPRAGRRVPNPALGTAADRTPRAGRDNALRGARRGLVAGALDTLQEWFLEPAETSDDAAPPSPPRPRPVVAVFGLARGCGATVVARALAVELAVRDPEGAAAVSCEDAPRGLPLASGGAARLAGVLDDLPGAVTRAVGRLCLVARTEPLALADTARYHAPLVIDAGSASIGGVPASIADHVVLVATPDLEPALAAVAARCVERVGPEPLVVVTRARGRSVAESEGAWADGGNWHSTATIALPESRTGARLALSGREPRCRLGQGVGVLADMCESGR